MVKITPNSQAPTNSPEYRAWAIQAAIQNANTRMDNLIDNAEDYRRGLIGAEDARMIGGETCTICCLPFTPSAAPIAFGPLRTAPDGSG